MLVTSLVADAFATNCYVVAPGEGEECVIVDPGLGIDARLDEFLSRYRLRPVAVLLTHGHLDHTFSVTPVCGAKGITAYIHPEDAELLADPLKGLSPETRAFFGGRLTWSEPDDVAELADGAPVRLAGLDFTVTHAPGHTRGSVMFGLPGEGDNTGTLLTGDVLFAGSIGRTDLPGGSMDAMRDSLRRTILPLDDGVDVYPGHGPATSIGAERRANPFLRPDFLGDGREHMSAPRRGL